MELNFCKPSVVFVTFYTHRFRLGFPIPPETRRRRHRRRIATGPVAGRHHWLTLACRRTARRGCHRLSLPLSSSLLFLRSSYCFLFPVLWCSHSSLFFLSLLPSICPFLLSLPVPVCPTSLSPPPAVHVGVVADSSASPLSAGRRAGRWTAASRPQQLSRQQTSAAAPTADLSRPQQLFRQQASADLSSCPDSRHQLTSAAVPTTGISRPQQLSRYHTSADLSSCPDSRHQLTSAAVPTAGIG